MFHSLVETLAALRQGEVSSLELTRHYLQKIEESRGLNAFISVDAEQALAEAQKADQDRAKNQTQLLTGVPIAHKDIFCTTRLPTTCGSKMLAHFQAPYEATIVSKLKDAGCITLGKTNMDEFAMGNSNQNSYFGAVKNPWDESCVPGGSSGGSACAVAAGLAAFATGSDTGGSIRQPAAFCGISGIKPTYGLASRFGMVAYASSLDQAGAFAHTAADLALILSVMTGFDPKDSTSMNRASPNYLKNIDLDLKGLRIGLPQCFFQEGIEHPIQEAIKKAASTFEDLGATIVSMDLKLHALWVPCYYVIACAEASSNLSRYDGLRYGFRSEGSKNLKDLITQSRTEGFGEEVKRRILTGTHVLCSGYFDAYYLQALKIRRMIRDELLQALNGVDMILGPTTPTTAFKLGSFDRDPIQSYLADIFTVSANLAGLPAISIPAGFDGHKPIGMQLMGSHFSEERLLQAAHNYQQNTDWHKRKPLK